MRFWRDGTHLPADFRTIERVLFDANPAHAAWRRELQEAYDQAKDSRSPEAEPKPPTKPPPNDPLLPPDRCLGRNTEIATLTDALHAPRAAVLVLGGPGIGKTTLTRAVAASDALAARFAARRWFVPLETAPDAASLRTAIVLALGLRPTDPAAFDLALAHLRQAPTLLVLDNLETPWEADIAATQDTLRRLAALPDLALLASLRGSEAPDSPAWSRILDLEPLPRDAARGLFLTFARRIKPNDALLDRFLDALGDVPLAVELVARRAAPHTSLAGLWGDWQRRGVQLALHPNLKDADRHSSLLRSIDLSLQSTRLRDEGCRLFRLLGLSPAGMAPDDRTAPLGDDATEAERQLLAIGLAVQRGDRLDLLPPVRDAVRHLALAVADERQSWCRHYLDLARKEGARIGSADGTTAVDRLLAELPNIEEAVRSALSNGTLSAAVVALDRIAHLMITTGVGSYGPIQDLAVACENEREKATCLKHLGNIAQRRSEYQTARKSFADAISGFEKVNDLSGQAACLRGLGAIARRRLDFSAARQHCEQALPMFRLVGDQKEEAICLRNLAEIALGHAAVDASSAESEVATARQYYGLAKAAFAEHLPLDAIGRSATERVKGAIRLREGDHEKASDIFGYELDQANGCGDVYGQAACHEGLAEAAVIGADPSAARGHYQKALALYHQIGELIREAQ